MEHVGLHPAVVHFPIVLIVAAFFLDVVALASARTGPATAARWAMWFGTATTALAVLSGHHDGDAARDALTPTVEALVDRHHDLALIALGGAAVLSLWRLLARRDVRFEWQLVYLILLAALVVQVTRTAYLGGRLVFERGVGVHAG
jgi:uncharacterized membrane protein